MDDEQDRRRIELQREIEASKRASKRLRERAMSVRSGRGYEAAAKRANKRMSMLRKALAALDAENDNSNQNPN
jgi:hypothetical protein